MAAELLKEYETERERLLMEPPSEFRDSLLRNLEDAIAVLRGNPLPDRNHRSKSISVDWLERLAAPGQDVMERTEDEPFCDPRLTRLTPRQREVLELVADGFSYRKIGDILGISSGAAHRMAARAKHKAKKM